MRWQQISGTLMVLVVACWSTFAQEQTDAKSQTNATVTQGAVGPAQVARLRAKLHQKMAELILAQSAEKPDPSKVAQLTAEIAKLRTELATALGATTPVYFGYGFGRGWWGGWSQPAGFSYGRGRGRGAAGPRGLSAGPRFGVCPWAVGPGLGAGRAGAAIGPTWRGRAVGPAWVDANGNGVCDNFEIRHPMGF